MSHKPSPTMNNKDFVNTLATQTGVSLKETKRLIEDFIQEFADHADDGTTFTIQGFGSFEVKKKLERIVNNPTTKQRMLVPPKLVLSFRPGAALKDRVK
ncbi:MAG: HU family DNA-binding protein [Alloprevotella sp.]|nr:HU family DNA-binding protein [Alloprevotella sp.]